MSSKKGYRKKWKQGYRYVKGVGWYNIDNYIKRYMLKRTTKRKHKNEWQD